ncbi:NUDIX hydrolase [Patescibacteria group bacterium]|nr:NUDIX hydrolase [Patescibacteria group bacterium]MBU4274645.1 NUDIX hydrolase [Patescibacteria group bacterium]MBU4367691.1 NUDIX hydrolase [Patescibacteria group bacterium]MBU4461859.1 NUDIX hydrolase [Patescibacteria group bacterium]MCG2700010.1 NUDIX hydrolase [Candidatus Parcubacteria bacterium]
MPKNNELEKHFTASALIIDNGKVLLVHHKKLGVWLYPGGHIEKNETPEQTVIREVKEETGLDVEIMGEKDNSLSDANADVSVLYNPYVILCELVGNHYHDDIVYLCSIYGNNRKIKLNEGELKDIQFFGIDELDNIKLFPNFRRLLEKVLRNRVD